MFTGIYTALVTPFKDGKIDEKAFQAFCSWQIEQGVHGLVPCGTTGESPTLSHAEHMRVVELCIEVAKGKTKVMAGTGSNSTAEAIEFTTHAKKAGADGALVVAPYYNKPTQEGIYQHYKAIHDATNLPIIIYNIPGRSVINISDDTIARLAKLPNIVGVKDATGDLSRPYSLRMALAKHGVTKPFAQLSGEDMTAVAFNAAGGVGCISVASNVAPKICAEVQALCQKGDFAAAAKKHEPLAPLNAALFAETSPGPVKYALSLMGKCIADLRLPLVATSKDTQTKMRDVLASLSLSA